MAKTYNVDIVGSLTNNDGVLSGFTANDYAKFNKPFTSEENKAVEIVVKFKLNSIPTDTARVIFGGDTYPSVSLRIRPDKKLRVGVPSRNGQELYNANGIDELSVNTTYYIKIVIPNTTVNPSYVRFYLSTTPTFPSTPSDLGVNVPYVIQLPSEVRFGNDGGTTQPFDGEIDLNECYASNNGVVVWEGVSEAPTPSAPIPKIGSNDISKIYLGSEEISKIYLGSEVIYEAPPTPTGPVFDLMQGHYISTDYDNAANFLAGNGSVALTLDPQGYPSYSYNRLLLTCDDWSNVRKLKITSQFDWRNGDVSVTTSGQSVDLDVLLSDSNKTLTCEIPSGVDRSTISGFVAIGHGSVAPNQSCTYSNFTVYDDNNNIIIPAS